MVVHPGAGNYDNTMVNGLLYEMEDLPEINGVLRPGIVHRIDKDTTGILVVLSAPSSSLQSPPRTLRGWPSTHRLTAGLVATASSTGQCKAQRCAQPYRP